MVIDTPLNFKLKNEFHMARTASLSLPHGKVQTPVFMPVGTYGAIKGLTGDEMTELGYNLILSNTYHLSNTPGSKAVESAGGLHNFMNYSGNLLTDSGGFQMVSLAKLSEVTEEGVRFENPKNGSLMLLTPEKSIQNQNEIGADIIMALDDVVKTTSTDKNRVEEACDRSVRWLDRCIKAHKNANKQNLFAIIQGGLHEDLRDRCLTQMVKRELPGYAIGGLSGGEEKEKFWRIVLQCTRKLPKDKPRYLMGVGYPLDLVVCTALGCDMYDCVFPSRGARFGIAYTRKGFLDLSKSFCKNDLRPVEEDCDCVTCRNYSRSYLYTIVRSKMAACTLITTHNFIFLRRLMRDMRESIEKNLFYDFVRKFLGKMFIEEGKEIPLWVRNALNAVGCEI